MDRSPVVDPPGDGAGVRVQQEPCRIEAASMAGSPVAVDTVAVLLALPGAGHEGMPDPLLVDGHLDVALILHRVYQRQLNTAGVGCPEAEADAVLLDFRAEPAAVEWINEHF